MKALGSWPGKAKVSGFRISWGFVYFIIFTFSSGWWGGNFSLKVNDCKVHLLGMVGYKEGRIFGSTGWWTSEGGVVVA